MPQSAKVVAWMRHMRGGGPGSEDFMPRDSGALGFGESSSRWGEYGGVGEKLLFTVCNAGWDVLYAWYVFGMNLPRCGSKGGLFKVWRVENCGVEVGVRALVSKVRSENSVIEVIEFWLQYGSKYGLQFRG